MAITKIKSIKGYNAEYWRISQLNSNFDRSDAVITLSLYKDKATRDLDSNATVDSLQYDLGTDFSNELYDGLDSVKNIKLQKAYKIFKDKAIAEAAKDEGKDESLAWFADAVDAI